VCRLLVECSEFARNCMYFSDSEESSENFGSAILFNFS
jgi:hypothetical protein